MFLINYIIFNKYAKNIAYKILKSKIPQNSFYQSFYQKIMLKKMAGRENRPGKIGIENTNICSANCSFCSHNIMKRKQGIMDMKLFNKIVDEAADWGIGHISLNGFGEPLLDPYFFERVDYCKKKGIKKIATNTNSLFLTKDKSDMLIKSGIDEVYVSCNELGYENAKYFCELKYFSKKKKPIIYLSGMKGNFEPAKYKGADGVSISFVHNWAGGLESDMSQVYRDPCKMLWLDMNVDWEGKVIICCMDYESKQVLGDASNNSLQEIWSGDLMRKYRGYHREKKFDAIGICQRCSYNSHYKASWWV